MTFGVIVVGMTSIIIESTKRWQYRAPISSKSHECSTVIGKSPLSLFQITIKKFRIYCQRMVLNVKLSGFNDDFTVNENHLEIASATAINYEFG